MPPFPAGEALRDGAEHPHPAAHVLMGKERIKLASIAAIKNRNFKINSFQRMNGLSPLMENNFHLNQKPGIFKNYKCMKRTGLLQLNHVQFFIRIDSFICYYYKKLLLFII
jgi:hypothetical protein